MTDKKDETGKGPAKPGESPRRPYATIDLQATEVGGKDKGEAVVAAAGTKTAPGASPLPPPGASKGDAAGRAGLAARLAAAGGWSRRATQSNAFLSHVAAGVAGAVLTLAAAALLGPFAGDRTEGRQDTIKRLASLEEAVRQRSGAGGDVTAKLAQTETRLKGLEDQARAIAALGDTQGKLAATLKTLEAKSSTPEYANRLAKMETALAALSAGDRGTPNFSR